MSPVPNLRLKTTVVQAPAKINLFLRVTGRRPDGYHFLSTWMQKVDLCDTVELALCESGVSLTCSGGDVPSDADNLVHRAADLFLQELAKSREVPVGGVAIRLTKKIPVAAGLGGGSSDAAATLRGMNELFGQVLNSEQLADLGVRLGADVPFFLADAPAALATGIGEILHPVAALRGYSIVLVNPGFPVSTRWVYQTFALTDKEHACNLENSQEAVSQGTTAKLSETDILPDTVLINDLERVTVASYPVVEQLKEELYRCGAVQALMSGSGPTVFGLFAEHEVAQSCSAALQHRFPFTYLVASLG